MRHGAVHGCETSDLPRLTSHVKKEPIVERHGAVHECGSYSMPGGMRPRSRST